MGRLPDHPGRVPASALPGNEPMVPGRNWKRGAVRLLIAAVWVGAVAMLAWAGWRNRDIILPYLLTANYARMLVGIPFYLGTLVASVMGWSMIMRTLTRPVSIWVHLRIYCATLAARRLPGTVWYIGGRLLLYHQLGLSRAAVSIASATELVITLIAGIILGLLLLPLGLTLPGHIVLILILGVLAASVPIHPAVLGAILRRFDRPLARAVSGLDLLRWTLVYAAAWLMGGLMVTQIVAAFLPVDGRQAIFILGAWALSGAGGLMTLVLPSSFGVTELALTFFLARMMPLPLAVTVAILTRILTTLGEVSLSIASYPFLKDMRPAPGGPTADSAP